MSDGPTPRGSADIEAHGAIGNLRTVALVSTSGSIDYLCHPRLDSPSVFCALLDPDKGGAFSIAPTTDAAWRVRQIYMPDTNVLITRFMDGHAVFEIADFMPILVEDGPRSAVLRRVTCVSGEVRLSARCAPRFDYGRDGNPKVTVEGGAAVFSPNGDRDLGPLRLRASIEVTRLAVGVAGVDFSLRGGESESFILECGDERPSGDQDPAAFVAASFDETIAYWQSWSAHSTYRGRWREYVLRSALVLKLPQFGRSRLDRRGGDLRLAGTTGRRTQLGLPLLLDARRRLRDFRPYAARLRGGGQPLQRLGRRPRRVQRDRRLPDPLSARRRHRGRRRGIAASRRLQGRPPGAHRQPGRNAAAARHLRRLVRLRISRRQARRLRDLRDLGAHGKDLELDLPKLGPARCRHLGDARRAPPFPVVAADVLGRARPRPASVAQALASRGDRGGLGGEPQPHLSRHPREFLGR